MCMKKMRLKKSWLITSHQEYEVEPRSQVGDNIVDREVDVPTVDVDIPTKNVGDENVDKVVGGGNLQALADNVVENIVDVEASGNLDAQIEKVVDQAVESKANPNTTWWKFGSTRDIYFFWSF